MQVMKTITVPAYTKEELDYFVCDICHEQFEEPTGYDVDKVTVSYRNGSSFPEGAFGETIRFDICPECFDTKLKPFICSFGSEPTIKDWN
jgi:hypothetical protein